MCKSCATCAYAMKAANEDFVFCGFIHNELPNTKGEDLLEKLNQIEINNGISLPRQIGTGWGYPNIPYNGEAHWTVKGTASESLMWNGVVCIHKDCNCNAYKSFKD